MRGCGAAVRAPPAPRRCHRCVSTRAASQPPPPSRSTRTAKNPADWGRDYDAIRADLQRGDSSWPVPTTFASALTFIGERFGGAGGTPGLERGAGFGAALVSGAYAALSRVGDALGGAFRRGDDDGSGEGPSDPAPLVRAASRAGAAERAAAASAWGGAQDAAAELAVTLALGVAVLAREASPGGASAALAAAAAPPPAASIDAESALAAHAAARMRALCATLLCTPTASALALRKERALLATGPAALATRVLLLRAAVPSADLGRLTLACPRLLAAPAPEAQRWADAAARLRSVLPGVNVDLLAQEDPELLLCDTRQGETALAALWTPEELVTLHPEHASLALRALCGLPRRGGPPPPPR